MDLARSGVDAARAEVRAARAAALPIAELSSIARLQGPFTRQPTLPATPGQPQAPRITPRGSGVITPNATFEPGLVTSAPLYTGGRIGAEKRAAGHAHEAALWREQFSAQSLVLDVTNAFLDTLEGRQQVGLQGKLRELNTERLRVAQVKLQAGVGLPLEVSQAEADLAAAVQREIDARARAAHVAATLNTLIGRPAAAPLLLESPPATAPGPALSSPATEPPTPDQLKALGLERPDLRALREDVKRTDAEIRSARAARRPQLRFLANYFRRVPRVFAGSYGWSAGFLLTQTLFDAGRSRAQVEAARAERARATASLREAERQAEEQVEQARIALEAAESRVAAEDRRVAAAAEALEAARTRRRAGTAAPIEVTEAEVTLTRAQTDSLTARFEAARTRVSLSFAAGLIDPSAAAAPAATGPGAR